MSLVKNLPTQWRETKEENRWLVKERKVVNKKPPDLRQVLEGNWSLMTERWRSQEVEVLTETVGWTSRAVTCNAAKDVELRSYLNPPKNMIKIKHSSLFSSFVGTVGWASSFLFERLCKLDCWSSHQWCSVNSRRSRGRLVKIIFVEQADKLSDVLDRWYWLSGIFFLRISFLRNQIVETW